MKIKIKSLFFFPHLENMLVCRRVASTGDNIVHNSNSTYVHHKQSLLVLSGIVNSTCRRLSYIAQIKEIQNISCYHCNFTINSFSDNTASLQDCSATLLIWWPTSSSLFFKLLKVMVGISNVDKKFCICLWPDPLCSTPVIKVVIVKCL